MGSQAFPDYISQNPWLEAYNQYGGGGYQPRQADYYFKQDDPYYQAYLQKSQETPQSESLIRNYLSSRPEEEDYKPSFMRKLGGFILGALSGDPTRAYAQAQNFTHDPYNDAMREWTDEGKRVDTRARLADQARTRELNTMKYGLDNRLKALRWQAGDEGKIPGQAARAATGIVGTGQRERSLDQGDARIQETKAQNDWMNAFRQQQQDFMELYRNAMLNLADIRTNHTVTETPTNPHANDPTEILKQRQATEDLALNDARSVSMFKPILDAMRQADTNGQDPWSVLDSLQIDPNIKSNFKDYIKSRIQKYQGRNQ